MLSLINPLWWAQLFVAALPWYLSMQLMSLAALPMCFGLCTRLHDRGYGLSKALGLILSSYLTFLLAYRIMPFSSQSVAASVSFIGLISVISLWRLLPEFADFVRKNFRLIAVYELVFLLAFVLMLAVRAQVPQVTYVISDWAAEKFTDFSILQGLLSSSWFPPHDVWVAGRTINYYYFGHFLWACMIKLTAYKAEVGFNLALAEMFALVCLQALSLGYNLTRRLGWAFLAVFLVAFSSNLDGFLQLIGIVKHWAFDGVLSVSAYDFWRSSRAIENTINEFPAFSFILGDLHAHVSSLVIFLAALGMALQLWRSLGQERSLLRFELNHLSELFFAALFAGALYAANSWDLVSYAGVLGVVFWTGRRRLRWREAPQMPARAALGWASALYAVEAAVLVVLLVAVGMVLFINFQKNFSPPTGIRLQWVKGWPPVHALEWPLRWVQASNRSDTIEFIVHWVMLLAASVALVAILLRRLYRAMASLPRFGGFSGTDKFWTVVCLGAALVFVGFSIFQGWVAALGTVAVLYLAAALLLGWHPPVVRLVLGLLLLFFFITTFCELLYLDDAFEGPIERINTVFKLYYAQWPLMALASVLALKRLVRYAAPGRRAWRAFWLVAPLVVAGGVYPVLGTLQRIQSTRALPPAKNALDALDGMRFLKYQNAADYEAILWVRRHVPPTSYILESVGQQYQYNGRIATYSGRPTVGGWIMHEWEWRPRFDAERIERTSNAETIYKTSDPAQALELLKKYHVEYVVVGDQERESYPELDEQKFLEIGKPVFRSFNGETSIYKINYLAQPQHKAPAERVKARPPEETPMETPAGGSTPQAGQDTWRELKRLNLETTAPASSEETTAAESSEAQQPQPTPFESQADVPSSDSQATALTPEAQSEPTSVSISFSDETSAAASM